MNDPGGLDLPLRRLLRVLLARLAGGIDAVLEEGHVAAGALAATRREAGLLGTVDSQRIDKAIAEVVAEIEGLAIEDLAVRLGQSDVALRVLLAAYYLVSPSRTFSQNLFCYHQS